MEDLQIIIYILAAVAYFIITQWRKAFSGGDEDVDVEPRRARPQQPPKPVTSFEDILRELQPKLDQANRQGQEVVRQTKERAREIVQPAPAMVPAEAPARKYKNYDEVAPKALSWEKRAEAIEAAKQSKLREQKTTRDAEPVRVTRTNRYKEMLRNPATARDAVILSEIFNRRYS
ncbi:hypothetical protein C8N40_103187 [Pontibacter mucosus]|uniref:Uncharacterized protein n=1 Tax=Pontibacter mucosus TaxID=1649266 RepID=A0A2T5YLF0_9BACT|nr:hypothetical protein [Pontibacter mucosus]PTX20112.1 hypothetical protein C8N40_103187 [Pontibacter mucosus]